MNEESTISNKKLEPITEESGVQNEERKDDSESKTDDKLKTTKTKRGRRRKKKDDKKVDEEADKVDKKAKKTVKSREQSSKKVIKRTVKLRPILESDYKEKINYLNKRIYHCQSEDKRKSYQNQLEKLNKRERLPC